MDLINFRRVPEMVVECISFDVLCHSRRIPMVFVGEKRTRGVKRVLRKSHKAARSGFSDPVA